MALSGVFESSPETASKLAAYLLAEPGDFLLLMNGEMGSGKTTFTRMLGAALGLGANITSPTFAGLHEYRGLDFDLLHFDIYQVGVSYYDLKELLLSSPARKLIVIEWAEKLEPGCVEQLRGEGVKILELGFSDSYKITLT